MSLFPGNPCLLCRIAWRKSMEFVLQGKYGTLKPCYHEFYRIYGAQTLKKDIKPEVVITEDSNSGYQFFFF